MQAMEELMVFSKHGNIDNSHLPLTPGFFSWIYMKYAVSVFLKHVALWFCALWPFEAAEWCCR